MIDPVENAAQGSGALPPAAGRRRVWASMGRAGLLVAGALALGGAAPAPKGPAPLRPAPLRIAFLAAGAQNGFNQSVWQGIRQAAARQRGVEVTLYDGAFDSTLQYNQLEDVIASHRYDGIILFPNDSVSIASAVRHAGAVGIRTVAVEFPIGPQLDELAPQVPGVVATVAARPSDGARAQAQDVVAYCAGRPQCNVVLVVGQKVYPFDLLRYRTYLATFAPHRNIRVVATIEGNYDAGTAMSGMLDVLQVNRRIDAVVSTADIQTIGVEMALKSYGIRPASVHLVGSGGSQIAVTALRQGRWAATYGTLTASMGSAALDALAAALRGHKGPAVIDADRLAPLPRIWTQETMRAHPAFTAQWAG